MNECIEDIQTQNIINFKKTDRGKMRPPGD